MNFTFIVVQWSQGLFFVFQCFPKWTQIFDNIGHVTFPWCQFGIEKIASDHIKVLWILHFYCFSQFTFAFLVLFHKLAFISFDWHWYHLIFIWFRELCLFCLLWYDIETSAENRRKTLCLSWLWHGMKDEE